VIAYVQIQQDDLNQSKLYDDRIHIDFFHLHLNLNLFLIELLINEYEVLLNKDVEIIVEAKNKIKI
jgi:hypothetical protein